jgi:hypothetical protein
MALAVKGLDLHHLPGHYSRSGRRAQSGSQRASAVGGGRRMRRGTDRSDDTTPSGVFGGRFT